MDYEELAKIIIRARKGETEALAELYSLSYNKVYFYAYKIFGNSEDATDIVQDVFIIVFTKLKDLKEPKAYLSWLSKITVNACKQKKIKDTKYIITSESNQLIENMADEDFNVEDIVADEDFKKYIFQVIDLLPEEQKRAVLLYYYEQLTIAQIAEIEETPESTIKNRLAYAREKMKKALRFEEKRSGVKVFSVGTPAVAAVLTEIAILNVMPIAAAREVFFAALAVAGVRGGKDDTFRFVDFNADDKKDSFWKKMKSGVIVEIKPIKLVILCVLLVALISGGAVLTKGTLYHIFGSFTVENVGEGEIMAFNVQDLPKKIRDEAAYYGEGFYEVNVGEVTPEMAYLRTSHAGGYYTDLELVPLSQKVETRYYTANVNMISLFNIDKELIAYTYCFFMGLDDIPEKLEFKRGFDIDYQGLKQSVMADLDKAFDDKDIITLTEEDFYFLLRKDDGDYIMKLNPNTAPFEETDVFSYTNVWMDIRDEELSKERVRTTLAELWMGKDKYLGEQVYGDGRRGLNIYQFGQRSFYTEEEILRYNAIALFDKNNKLFAYAYLDDQKMEFRDTPIEPTE